MPLDTQALPVSLEAQISWQDRGCSTAVERKPHNRKLMRSRVQITALKSFFYFISLSRVSLSRFVKEVQHFSWKMVAEQLSMDTASTIGTELAKRKLKPIENCRILNARTIFIFSFRFEQDSNQWKPCHQSNWSTQSINPLFAITFAGSALIAFRSSPCWISSS